MAATQQPNVTPADLAADRARALDTVPVSHETAAKLDGFVDHLLRVAPHLNLIARSTLPNVWTRHVADSLQLMPLAPDAKCWVDLGSGAGFPGLVIACALAGRAGATVHLVESIGKKAAFLREAVNLLQVPAVVHVDGTGRLQTLSRENNGRFYELVKKFHEQTGVPILLNTSFNRMGEPIVETPADAIRCLLDTGLDCCVFEDRIVFKIILERTSKRPVR